MVAFRHVLTGVGPPTPANKAVVQQVWRALLPGLAQLWFRVADCWQDRWPFKLLQLLREELTQPERNTIATDFLAQAKSCCLDEGGNLAKMLKTFADELPSREPRISEFGRSVVRSSLQRFGSTSLQARVQTYLATCRLLLRTSAGPGSRCLLLLLFLVTLCRSWGCALCHGSSKQQPVVTGVGLRRSRATHSIHDRPLVPIGA